MGSSISGKLDKPLNSVGKPDIKPLISVGKPDIASDEAMRAISAAKPDIAFVVAFYNITWDNSRFNQQKKHERNQR